LGQFGLNIKDFCDKFNEQSKNYDSDFIVTVWITLYSNKTLSFIIKTPPLSFLINEDDESIESDFFSYYVALSTLYKVVKIKNKDLKINELSIFKSLIGTLKGMNIVLINNTFNKN
jgi:large subunit ribosomal protein L11